MDPSRVVRGHSGDTTGSHHLSELADRGFVLGMDGFGIEFDTPFEARADTLVEMVGRGDAERMVLCQDAVSDEPVETMLVLVPRRCFEG